MEELHDKELTLWQVVKEQYEMRSDSAAARKIKQLKPTIQEMKDKVEMNEYQENQNLPQHKHR